MNKVTNKELRSVFWRSFALQGAFNYERMQNIGYAYSMLPIIKKLYTKKEDQVQSLNRHLEIFNTTPAVVPLIMGISSAMEEENSNNPEFDEQSISAVKASLMGPLAGIGDSIFWGTLRIIAAGIGVSLASEGNLFGPLLFFLIFNIPNFAIRIFGLKLGYQVGINSLERIQKEGLMDKIMSVATIIGLSVVGGMVATMLNITTPLQWNLSGAEIIVQDILDQILPKMLPLIFTFVIYRLLKKVSVTWLTLGIIIFGIVMHFFNIL
ncbi:PTS system, fructoselysine/glucoselysine-specific IID component [Enterococcus sp. DIV2402]|uniref:PTS system, fructoselysine/glucoselysine-specific IID component n=1 Tax=Candidatus Enterococcus lowellii TaxID=2230877 RepID=A0ABZ2SMR2_9ENTE|nr:PTS system mannose/fructose/sorbose family transporter subunit IID [Enterococcus sp. DIV2402]MBO0464078.1 PTS system mannose/fructose/sorbose family transporter subunit IID [Enterococcus sp. DIV2402]